MEDLNVLFCSLTMILFHVYMFCIFSKILYEPLLTVRESDEKLFIWQIGPNLGLLVKSG